MFARLTTTKPRPDHLDDAVRNFRERVIPESEKLKGFKGSLVLVDRKASKLLSITLWESEGDMKASEQRASQVRAQAVEDVGLGDTPTVEHLEVVMHM